MRETGGALTLEVATPAGLAVRTEAYWVQLPSVLGELSVLPQHIPLLAAVNAGALRYRSQDGDQLAAIGTGYVEVGPEIVRLLTDEFAKADEIELDRAQQQLVEAHERLDAFDGPAESQTDQELASAVAWAQALVRIANEQSER